MTTPSKTSLARKIGLLASMASIATAAVAVSAVSAEAQSRGHSRSVVVTGPNHSASRNTNAYRSRGSASVNRSGTVDGQAWSSSPSRSTVATADGYATTATHTGVGGNTQTRSSEVSCADGACSRDSSVQTSNGYGYTHSADASRDASGSTVSRSTTTNAGASRSTTVVRPY